MGSALRFARPIPPDVAADHLFSADNQTGMGLHQYAIWSLGRSRYRSLARPGPCSPNDKINGYLSWASSNYQNYNYDNVYV